MRPATWELRYELVFEVRACTSSSGRALDAGSRGWPVPLCCDWPASEQASHSKGELASHGKGEQASRGKGEQACHSNGKEDPLCLA